MTAACPSILGNKKKHEKGRKGKSNHFSEWLHKASEVLRRACFAQNRSTRPHCSFSLPRHEERVLPMRIISRTLSDSWQHRQGVNIFKGRFMMSFWSVYQCREVKWMSTLSQGGLKEFHSLQQNNPWEKLYWELVFFHLAQLFSLLVCLTLAVWSCHLAVRLTEHNTQIKFLQEHMVHRGPEKAFVATPARDLTHHYLPLNTFGGNDPPQTDTSAPIFSFNIATKANHHIKQYVKLILQKSTWLLQENVPPLQ